MKPVFLKTCLTRKSCKPCNEIRWWTSINECDVTLVEIIFFFIKI